MMKSFLVKTIPFPSELGISVFICAWLAILSSGKHNNWMENSKVIKYEKLWKMNREINKRWLGISSVEVNCWWKFSYDSIHKVSYKSVHPTVYTHSFKGVKNRNVNIECNTLYITSIIIIIYSYMEHAWMNDDQL